MGPPFLSRYRSFPNISLDPMISAVRDFNQSAGNIKMFKHFTQTLLTLRLEPLQGVSLYLWTRVLRISGWVVKVVKAVMVRVVYAIFVEPPSVLACTDRNSFVGEPYLSRIQ